MSICQNIIAQHIHKATGGKNRMKNMVVLFFYMLLFISAKSETNKINYTIYYYPEDICTLIPLCEGDVINKGTMKKSIMSENDYSSIFSCLEKRKEIKKIKTYQNFDIDDLFDDDSDDTKKIDKERTGTPDYTVEDISDFHLDIRYVIVLRKDGAVIRIAYGICSNIVKIDGKFYELSSEDRKTLLNIIGKYLK